MKKKILIAVGVLAAIFVIGLIVVYIQLDSIVKTGIETIGPEATGNINSPMVGINMPFISIALYITINSHFPTQQDLLVLFRWITRLNLPFDFLTVT